MAADLVCRGGWKYYDPETKSVTHPKFGHVTDPVQVTPYAADWVGKQLIDYWRSCTSMPVFTPTNSYAVKTDGKYFIDGFHHGNLKEIDVNTPSGWLFLNGGNPRDVYEAGVDVAIADNPELFEKYLDGEPIAIDAHLNFEAHNYERYGV